MVTACMSLGSVAVGLFPTSVGAMALSFGVCAGRIGAIVSNLVFGLFMDKQCEIPIFLMSSCVLISAGFCLLIPNTHKKK